MHDIMPSTTIVVGSIPSQPQCSRYDNSSLVNSRKYDSDTGDIKLSRNIVYDTKNNGTETIGDKGE